ncbi:MAG TPA: DUF3142 domain-containing protein [Dongiaceae bacterium]|nr:DUF3142 domain-containing protein [Dongiaceae bacterium]
MSRLRAFLLAILLALPCSAAASTTNVEDYDAFWLWAGVKPQSVLAQARSLYLLQGEVTLGDPPRLIAQRAALPRIDHAEVWMVVRVQTLAWPDAVYAQVLAALERWRGSGNHVVGVQIDFDAATRHLQDYAAFLGDLRRRLPAGTRLGVTGLLDWSAHGDPAGLDALAGVVDEVVLQIYQGRRVIPGYEAYLENLDRLRLPFRIGLLQGGDWSPPPTLETHPWFRGYVVFLLNDSSR